ncbi:MAG: DUF3943 domain-containing protein [Candidatus Marinimicrobia bacterium]|nr:DUF3943 domain-containing protein [Candidatus Neomarinimicrobiota bacterium]
MRYLWKRVIIILICVLPIMGQFQPSDSVFVAHPHRNALLHSMGQPVFIWAVNWYVLDQYWADISINTLQTNIETGWVWDEDGFDVNQVGHPTQGALVYTAARAQGLSYWQSLAYPTLASLIWEVGMENESPSINDMITTPMSGVAFGEIIHRLSVLTLGPGAKKSVSRQVLTGLINPLGYGFNRLVMGESIHQQYNLAPTSLLSSISYGGGPGYKGESGTGNSNPRRFVRFSMVYGNPLARPKNFKPFDNFNFVTILNFSRRDYIGEIYASGMLAKLYTKHSDKSNLVVAVFQNYDFMNQDDYKVSSSSVGPGLIHVYSLTPSIKLGTHVNGSFIFMGSAGDISDDLEVRDYHFGQGFSAKFMGRLMWADRGQAYIRLKRYFIYAMEDTHVEGYENINLLTMGGQVKVNNKYGIGLEYLVASRTVSYLDIDRKDTLQKTSLYRIYLSYYLKNTLFNTS